jgi:serine/threonine protein kinase/tetratricopeptide (TPR) repeat protein
MGTNRLDEQAIFEGARKLAAGAARDAYLRQVCGDDAAQGERVRALLGAYEQSASFLEVPPSALHVEAGLTVDAPITERPGTVIGPYKLMEQIGEGGMGLVFVAEQQQPIRRKVALKVIKPGLDTRQVIARFESERQALALMDHENIAKVLDAGATASGRPYFVMELVKGMPLTDYCDHNQLAPRERLALFLPVCAAVQHAHQKGIIHRDLKPSNVLVASHDGTPVVKVIDFGVAKAIGQPLTDKTVYTHFTQLVGTPLYMSPEQAGQSSLDIDTRTDIYALGVLLYELLTGTTPFDKERLRQASYEEIRRIIREEEPPRPSTRISTLGQAATTVSANRKSDPKQLSRLVRGELDWMVMKALEKDRNRRYETASALAADVQHYLHDEPVQACPPSAAYRFRKFARRNRVALTIATVVTAALLAITIGQSASLLLLGRANARTEEQRDVAQRQRDLAKANFQKALQAVDDYFTKVSENRLLKSPVPGLQPLRKELLETALKYYQAFVEEHPEEPSVRSELARAYFRVGSIQEEIATKAEAFQAYQASRGLWEQLVHDEPANSEFQHQKAECLRKIGRLQIYQLGQPAEGLRTVQDAQALYEELARAEPRNLDIHRGLARTYGGLAYWAGDHPQELEELQFHRKALEIWQRLADEDPRFQSDLGSAAMNLGYYYTRAGKASEALESFEQARKIFAKLGSDHPRDAAFLGELRRVYSNIGCVHASLTGQYQKALSAYDETRRILEQLTGENPAVPEYQLLKAGLFKEIGGVLSDTKHFDQAEDYHRQAVAIVDKIVAADHRDARAKYWRGVIYGELGWVQMQLDQLQEALESCQETQAILEKLLDSDQDNIEYAIDRSRCYEVVASVKGKMARWEEAIQSYQRGIELLERIPENSRQQNERLLKSLISLYTGLGDVQRAAGQRVEAEHSYRQLLDIREKYFGGEDRRWRTLSNFCPAWISLGQLQSDGGKPEDARRTWQQARTLLEQLPQPRAQDLYYLACVRAQLSRLVGSGQTALAAPAQAEHLQYLDQAMDALRKAVAAGYCDVAELKKDASLDPLRERDDFQKILAQLEKQASEVRSQKSEVNQRRD